MRGQAYVSESLYRQGAHLWIERRLDDAIQVLEAALDAAGGPDDPWWFSASRALAQIAMEEDHLDSAAHHLRRLPGHGIGRAQQVALRARRAMLLGDSDTAAIEASAAVGQLGTDPSDDVGSLMNGAIALAWVGEVLVEIGHGEAAAWVAADGRNRIARAGIDDPALDAMLTMVEAQSARLTGDPSAAYLLAEVDQKISPDLAILVCREEARQAWERGDSAMARSKYEGAMEQCAKWRYPALSRLIAAERDSAPPKPRSDPDPIERWAERSMERHLAAHRPYALVLRLLIDNEPGRYLDLEAGVNALLQREPELGEVDGFGADGDVWELFVDGDDPAALWDAVGPLIEDANPPAGSEVDIRVDDRVISVRLT